MKSLNILLSFFLLFITPSLVWAHGTANHPSSPTALFPPKPLTINAGKLPGITWADDIHQIFIRNKCDGCHTRGNNEAIVEGLTEFALGFIDPKDPLNPYYSYHELVYAEGSEMIHPNETLRAGQCCWPKDYPAHLQRRIWIGYPERSALLRKLERDYFNWEKPPRYLEEGLRLTWGMPMPMWENATHEEMSGHQKNQVKLTPKKVQGRDPLHDYKVRSLWEQLLFMASVQFGGKKDKLYTLEPPIPVQDRTILRYWIANTLELKKEGTGIKIILQNEHGKPVAEKKISLIGNYNDAKRTEVSDVVELFTDKTGTVEITFPINSVISSNWYVQVEGRKPKNGERSIQIAPGEIRTITLLPNQES